jgi:hypothetical protein
MFDSSHIDAHAAAIGGAPAPAPAPAPRTKESTRMQSLIENITYDYNIPIYKNITQLLAQRKNELRKETSILFFMNGDSGLGSQLTQFAQCAYFLNAHFNPNLYCYPYFYSNNDFFKYYDPRFPGKNTFFMYFRAARVPPDNAKLDNIYFIENHFYSYYPFFIYNTPPVAIPNNEIMLRHYYNSFNLRIGENIFNYINEIRTNEPDSRVIGLHVRSAFQKRHHSGGYLQMPIRMRLEKLRERLRGQKYVIFLATDTKLYIKWCVEIFGADRVQYIENIERIENEEDSVPNFSAAATGFKLGADILYDCLALSLCDYCFVSNSNIPFIINMLNMEIPMFEY